MCSFLIIIVDITRPVKCGIGVFERGEVFPYKRGVIEGFKASVYMNVP
jgi:hypothetical protein